MSTQHTAGRGSDRAKATLYLIPTPLDFGCGEDSIIPIEQTIPLGTLQIAAHINHWITENAKSTRAFLKRVDAYSPLSQPVQALNIQELPRNLHKHGDFGSQNAMLTEVDHLLQPALTGHCMALVSEAGLPAVADPGALVVRAAHRLGIGVCVLSGPSALLMALASSGLNGQNFAFVGYLPQDQMDRKQKIRELEALSTRTGQTQLFIETPYRNSALVESLLTTLKPTTRLSVACGLGVIFDNCSNGLQTYGTTVAQWKHAVNRVDWRLPCVFMLGR